MTDNELEMIVIHIMSALDEDPISKIATFCTCIDHCGHEMGLSHEEIWRMVNEVKDQVYKGLGEYNE